MPHSLHFLGGRAGPLIVWQGRRVEQGVFEGEVAFLVEGLDGGAGLFEELVATAQLAGEFRIAGAECA